MIDQPIAYFITWTVYGTHLQGALTGWRKYGRGEQPPRPRLEYWRRERLKYPVMLLDDTQRAAVEQVIVAHCHHRNWKLWAQSVRTNHVHVVVTATQHAGSTVRDQFKANGTRVLRELNTVWRDRPVWSMGGDWQCINSEEELDDAAQYVRDYQDHPSAATR